MGKDIRISVRLSEKEKQTIQAKAKKCGLSASEYVKQRALGYEPRTVPTNNPYWADWFYTWFLGMVDQWRARFRQMIFLYYWRKSVIWRVKAPLRS